ncbi:11975_t:CDS:2 [Ambispora leptoticha]|uniref:11975_t:CDS:1 n=1 Tax=Ambispora leptoticha TaxID=144679 RepID=A0A9N9ASW8_9GLOM|nr:11975_t:CDS:2 [Ambispora leptoticha]
MNKNHNDINKKPANRYILFRACLSNAVSKELHCTESLCLLSALANSANNGDRNRSFVQKNNYAYPYSYPAQYINIIVTPEHTSNGSNIIMLPRTTSTSSNLSFFDIGSGYSTEPRVDLINYPVAGFQPFTNKESSKLSLFRSSKYLALQNSEDSTISVNNSHSFHSPNNSIFDPSEPLSISTIQ